MSQPFLLSQCMYLLRVTNQNQVCNVISQHTVGGSQGALLGCLRKHDALLVALSALNDFLY